MRKCLLALALVLVGCVPSQAAWVRVTSGTAYATATTTATTLASGALGAAVSTGASQRVIAVVRLESKSGDTGYPRTTSGVTDSLGNTYAKDLAYSAVVGGTFTEDTTVWSAPITVAGTPTLTATFTGTAATAHSCAIGVVAYSGLNQSASPVDISKGQWLDAQASGPYDSGTTSGTTSAANELKLGIGQDTAENGTLTAGTVDATYLIFLKHDLDGSNDQMAIEDVDSGASGSTARAEVTTSAFANGDAWGAAVLVYKLPGAAPSCTPTLALLGVGRCG